jgi:hypothetical protein
MNRRRFLAALGALPFAPAALKQIHLDEEWERFDREARPRPLPPADVLGVAMGEPTALTVTIPPDRLLKITASVFLADGGSVTIQEAPKTVLAYTEQAYPGIVEAAVMVRPTPGSHTYKLVVKGEVVDTPIHRPSIAVRDLSAVA